MNISIEKTKLEDVRVIIGFLREFAKFEHLSEFCEITEAKLLDAMFGDAAFVEGLMAFADGQSAGYSLFYPNFSSFSGQLGFYVEDIYISKSFRGKGIGRAILGEIARLAKTRGFERIDFQVLEWNTEAVNFYKKLGAEQNANERHFKFSDNAFSKLLMG